MVVRTEVAAGPTHSIPKRRDRQADDGWFGRAWSHVNAIASDRHIQIAPLQRLSGDQLVPPTLRGDQTEDCIVGRAVAGTDQRQKCVSNPVAAVIALGIRVVFAPGLVDFTKCVAQLFAAKPDQRADQQEVAVDFALERNPAHTDRSGAAKELVQDGFDLIVGIVCGNQAAGTASGHRAAQEIIALIAQSGFISRRVDAVWVGFGDYADSQFCGELLDERLVSVGRLAAKFVVEVGQSDQVRVAVSRVLPRLDDQSGQRDAVRTAADRQHDPNATVRLG